jgi:replicative DNA helicase
MMGDQPLRVPPSNVQAEAAALGSMILDAGACADVRGKVSAEDFYRPAHQALFAAIAELADSGHPVDLVSVRDRLIALERLEEVGGLEYVVELVNGVPTAANAGYYANVVRQKSVLRKMILAGSELAQSAYDPAADVDALLSHYQQLLLSIDPRVGQSDRQAVTLAEGMAQALREAEAASQEGKILGIYSGLSDLDAATGGLRYSENVVISGRTGSGKSTVGLHTVLAAAEQGEQCLIVSGEMPARQVAARALQARASIYGKFMRTGQLRAEHWQALNDAEVSMRDLPIHIIGRKLTVPEIGVEARRIEAQTRRKVRVVMIDTIQLMRPHTRGGEYEQMTAKSEAAKELALEQDCIVLTISQFRRDDDRRLSPPPPSIQDLKGSGSLENDADMVLLMHAPKHDTGENFRHPTDRHALEVWVRIGKGRGTGETRWALEGGQETGGIRLRWHTGFTRFANWSD